MTDPYVPRYDYSFQIDQIGATTNTKTNALRNYVTATISVSDTGEGTISMDYPSGDFFYPPALIATTPEVAVSLSLRYDGVDVSPGEIDGCRFFLEDMEYDPTFPDAGATDLFDYAGGTTVTSSGRNILSRMDFVSPWWNDGSDNRSYAPPVTLAQVVNVWTGDFVTNWSATMNPPMIWVFPPFGNHLLSTVDQFGLPFPEVGVTYRNGTSLGDLMRDWRDSGLIWLRSAGRTISPLTIDPGFNRASDPDIGFNCVLQRSRDFVPGSRWRESDRDQVNALTQRFGTFGARVRTHSAPIITGDREVRESYLPTSNVDDSTEAAARIAVQFAGMAVPTREVTLKLAFGPNSPVPFHHYKAGDWVWVDYGLPLGLQRHKIRQLTVTLGEGGRPTEGEIVCEAAPPPVTAQNRDALRRIYRGFDSTVS